VIVVIVRIGMLDNSTKGVFMQHIQMVQENVSKTGVGEKNKSYKNRVKYTLPQLKLCLVGEPSRARKLIPIQAPEDAARFLNPLRYAAEEHFVSLHLNARHEILGLHEVSHGSLSASLVHPREVFKAALLANSYAIIVCHNHPSGSSVVPSREDLETTGQLFNAGKLLGVTLIDHLIVGPGLRKNTVYSVREHHPELWKSL
jgi:DNA repair protein RadC